MSASSDILTARRVTTSLSRAHQSLGASVLVAETAAGRLREDGEVIQDTLHEHAYELKTGLSRTKLKLVRVRLQELWETYSLFGSVGFFFTVCLYIVMRRTLMLHMLMLWFRATLRGSQAVSELLLARDADLATRAAQGLDDPVMSRDGHLAGGHTGIDPAAIPIFEPMEQLGDGTGLDALREAKEAADNTHQVFSGISIDVDPQGNNHDESAKTKGPVMAHKDDTSASIINDDDNGAGAGEAERDYVPSIDDIESPLSQEADPPPSTQEVESEGRQIDVIDARHLGAGEL